MLTRMLVSGGLILASGCVLLAQRGGSHGSAGIGHAVSGRAAPAARASVNANNAFVPNPIIEPFGRPIVNPYSRQFRNGNVYNRNFGRYPFSYFLTPYYYPFLDYGATPYYDSYPYEVGDVPQDPAIQEQQVAQNIGPQYSNYPSAYANYLPPQAYAPPGPYAPPPGYQPPPASAAPAAQTPPAPPITLVLVNGQKVTVQNYAVMGQTFWDFSTQPAHKIPLASINIPASEKATEANGAEFPSLTGK